MRNKEIRTGIVPPPDKRYKYYDLLNELDVTGVLLCTGDGQDNSENDRSQADTSIMKSLHKVKKRRRSTMDEEFTDVEYLNERTIQFNEIDGDPLFEELEELTEETNPRIKTEQHQSSIITTIHPHKPQIMHTQSTGLDDEYTLFGKLIAEKLRRMPKQRANRLEMKVMALLLIGDE